MKIRTCRLIQNKNYRELVKFYNAYKLNFNEFQDKLMKCISENNYSEYTEYIDKISTKMMLLGINPEEAVNVCSLLDNYYIQVTSRYFIIDKDKVLSILALEEQINFDVLDEIGDAFIEFRLNNGEYDPVVIKLCKTNYKMDTRRFSDLETYTCSILMYDTKTDSLGCRYSFNFCKELVGKYLIGYQNSRAYLMCATCDKACNIPVMIHETHSFEADFCLVSTKRITAGMCPYLDYDLKPDDIVKLIAYIAKMYHERKNLKRKNAKHGKVYNKHKIHVATGDNNGKETIIDLNNLYSYEKVNKPWQGGHHNSPVEHTRRAHQRVYRNSDGSVRKIVEVHDTVVNAGNKKGVYHL